MRSEEMTEARRPDLARHDSCVVVAFDGADAGAYRCLESLLASTPEELPIVAALTAPLEPDGELGRLLEDRVAGERQLWLSYAEADSPSDSPHDPAPAGGAACLPRNAMTAAVDRALRLLWPADVALLSEPCLLTPGWVERMRAAAHGDSNTATASALADVGGELALCEEGGGREDLAKLAETLAEHTLRLHPRLSRAVGPCVFLRRDALELVGPLDEELDLCWALEVDFAQRCVSRDWPTSPRTTSWSGGSRRRSVD
jgi:hypothetical protein